ncbi:hypothetical protein PR202_gb02021 [Eleusine coracana subsp. coracana]|uniref:Bifunctional inhibitor/plant lipid transfer protein/seed storage helical domain-containing protein n=1 Tax=Eleusine coracana subsp. coracana TaxID=191504 RepID=A0AAV5DWP1_ELECO|nr:hypothetical protein PR202_gb02021 [Eleusine coracana subsp. coracana]
MRNHGFKVLRNSCPDGLGGPAAAVREHGGRDQCEATQLSPCAGAIIGNAAPTAACCSRMREQQPCMCTYARDPNLQRYVDSPNGKKVMAACKVPVPSC